MNDFREDDQYFYCQDYDKNVNCHKGMFYVIEGGREVLNNSYSGILIGEIWYEDISEELYYAELAKSAEKSA